MIKFALKRLIFAVLVIFCVQFIVFALTFALGSPAKLMLPATATADQVAQLDRQLGYDRPFLVQLVDLVTGSFVGDFGTSYWQQVPAGPLVFDRILATLVLVGLAMTLAILVAIPLGIVAAVKRNSIWDRLAVVLSLAGVSIPVFWLGYLLIILFSVQLGWLPTSGTGTAPHYVLPVVTLAVLPMGRLTQIVRSSMLDELGQQYMLVGRSLGLRRATRIYKHALKNASVPILTMTGWEVSQLIAGFTVLIEVVFSWPGLGQLAVQAIAHRDVPLLTASVTVVAVLIVVLNFTLELAYSILDPRIRASASPVRPVKRDRAKIGVAP